MTCIEYSSPAFIDSLHSHNAPYNSSLASSASLSSTSIWSDASSQNSDDTSITHSSSDSDSCDSYNLLTRRNRSQATSNVCDAPKLTNPWAKQLNKPQAEAPPELRQNPRRTSTSRTGCPPSLVRQNDRKVNFVDNLVDSSTQIVEAIWPTSSLACRNENGSNGVLPLRTFIQETLRRSRTSYSTLQVALYYLILIKPHVSTRDLTAEQKDDCYASRALQCGRRMFLAALILASKYLQDRNYSARAWSKISGLNTNEINQNEMAFVKSVNWKLHITDEVYNRWTDCVMKHTPSQPPSTGSCAQQLYYERQCEVFKHIILHLAPELDNLEEILPASPPKSLSCRLSVLSPPRSLFTPAQERSAAGPFGGSANLTKASGAPTVMEPALVSVHTPGRLAPALGLLPTPRLTPQLSGLSTPAASAASHMLGRPSMSFAMAQPITSTAQLLDRWPVSFASPQSHAAAFTARRSSLANTVSTASSPESMVSDSSRTSRSSSISSASSLASAPSTKLGVQARCRYAKQFSERRGPRTTITSVPEDYGENMITSSPASYAVSVNGDPCDLHVETPRARGTADEGDVMGDSEQDAARALQELQNYRYGAVRPTSMPSKAGFKRSRTASMDNPLQDSVRDMLAGRYPIGDAVWTDAVVQSGSGIAEQSNRAAARITPQGGRKRVCCSAEAADRFGLSHLASVGGFGGFGILDGILN